MNKHDDWSQRDVNIYDQEFWAELSEFNLLKTKKVKTTFRKFSILINISMLTKLPLKSLQTKAFHLIILHKSLINH
jgi:hypothetical protein